MTNEHDGKIFYVGWLIAAALSGFWAIVWILVFGGLLFPVFWALDRFPRTTIWVGFAGFISVLFWVTL